MSWNTLTDTGKLVLGLLVLVLVGLVLWWVFIRPAHLKDEATQANANAVYSNTEAGASKMAINELEKQGYTLEQAQEMVKEGNNDIRNASGAQDPVSDDSNAAGIRALCMHPYYRSKSQCVELLGPNP